jgi:D-alanyl-D-alanine dipeptidase
MKRRVFLSLALAPAVRAGEHSGASQVLAECRQLLRVETPSWNATSGILTLWERERPGAPWRQNGRAIPVVVGRNGLRWGLGWHAPRRGSMVKREGDGCSPAGIFSLDTAFGSMPAAESGAKHWPWQRMTPAWAGVDDPKSRHYNRVVNSPSVKKDWQSAEDMMPKSGAYRRAVVVRHNWQQRPYGGSCIFLHVRPRGSHSTAGCTAMSERRMVRLLGWLDPARHPLLVQLPAAEWRVRARQWNLPPANTIPARETTKSALPQR